MTINKKKAEELLREIDELVEELEEVIYSGDRTFSDIGDYMMGFGISEIHAIQRKAREIKEVLSE